MYKMYLNYTVNKLMIVLTYHSCSARMFNMQLVGILMLCTCVGRGVWADLVCWLILIDGLGFIITESEKHRVVLQDEIAWGKRLNILHQTLQ